MKADFYKSYSDVMRGDGSNVNKVTLDGEPFNGVELEVKHTLEMADAMAFIKCVVDSCIDNDNAEYKPEAFDIAAKIAMLHFYADVDIPKDVIDAFYLLHRTHVADYVMCYINREQYAILLKAATDKIEHECDVFSSTAGAKVLEAIEFFSNMQKETEAFMSDLQDPKVQEAMNRYAEENKPAAPKRTRAKKKVAANE